MAYGTKCGENITNIFLTEEELLDSVTLGHIFATRNLAGYVADDITGYTYGVESIAKGSTSSHLAFFQCFPDTGASSVYRIGITGCNEHGQLGNLSTVSCKAEVTINPVTNPIDCLDHVCAAMGSAHTLSVKVDGSLWAWGRNNCNQLGEATTISRSSPVQVSLSGWKRVAGGEFSSFAISSNNSLYAWGDSRYGQSGIPSVSTSSLSTPTFVGSGYKCVSAGSGFAVALKTDNTLWVWGNNPDGRLGLGDTINRSSPVQICPNKLWKKVSAGPTQVAAIDMDGNIYVWGYNCRNNLGLGITTAQCISCPVQLTSPLRWRDVSINNQAASGITTEGAIYVWGSNSNNMLGLGCFDTAFIATSPTILFRPTGVSDNCPVPWQYNDVEAVNVSTDNISFLTKKMHYISY
jgi:alpha-tubulin suppressor-like RCC1 family protein